MVVVAKKFGHLGNRLFLFAHLVANAIERPQRVLNLSFGDFCDDFANLRFLLLPRFPAPRTASQTRRAVRPARIRRARQTLYIAVRRLIKLLTKLRLTRTPLWEIVEAKLDDVADLGSSVGPAPRYSRPLVVHTDYFLHDYVSFRRHQAEIRSFFAPVESLVEETDRYVAALRAAADLLVGVHVRRGDYATWRKGRYFYTFDEYDFYMRQVVDLNRGRRVKFVICSNEKVPAEHFERLDVSSGPGTAMGDLLCLSACDLIMGPPSSFSRWAAFYGAKPIFSIETRGQTITIGDFRSVFDLPWLWHGTGEVSA